MTDQADRLRELIRQMKEREQRASAKEHPDMVGQSERSRNVKAVTVSGDEAFIGISPDGKRPPAAGIRAALPNWEDASADFAKETRVIAVASGKGGVGKTNFVLNFGLALRQLGHRVLIWDADFGFSNLHVLMGQTPSVTLLSLLEKELDIWQAVTPGVEGLEYISSGQGMRELFHLTEEKLNHFLTQFMQLRTYADYLLIDLGAGLSTHSLKLIQAADELILLTTPEPTSMTDAYALLKLLVLEEHLLPVHLVINRAKNEREGVAVQKRMAAVAERFLSLQLNLLGVLLDDQHVEQAVVRQQPYMLAFPKSPISRRTRELAQRFIDGQPSSSTSTRPMTRASFWGRFREIFHSVSPISHGKR